MQKKKKKQIKKKVKRITYNFLLEQLNRMLYFFIL